MGDFLTLEEAAERLGVSVTTLRQWIRRGRARASRRGGAYVLRDREVERLQRERPLDEPETDDAPEPSGGETSLEAGLLVKMQQRLERLEQAQAGGSSDELASLRSLLAERDSQVAELGSALAVRHEELKKIENEARRLRERLTGGTEQSESLQARIDELTRENRDLSSENNELVREAARLTRREEELSGQLTQLAAVTRERDDLSEKVRQMEFRLAQAARQAQWEAAARRTIEELEYECDELRHQLEEQRMALQLRDARGGEAHQALYEEASNLRHELAAAFEAARRAKEIRTDLEDEVARLNEQLTRAQGRIGGLEREVQAASDRLEEREHFLEAENRRLKDHLNTLQYKLEMAGEGGGGAAESRELLERISILEEQMLEKDRLLQEDSREKMSLRERVEILQRELYEIQARYDKEKSEWSALLAREIQNRDRLIQQSYDPTPRTQGGGGGGGWGLFRPKNDAR